jgi:hypothetical protein
MSTTETSTEIVPAEQQQQEIHAKQAPRPPKKLRPARKQVKPGDVVKTETVQTGKEYSKRRVYQKKVFGQSHSRRTDIWYNKWAGGDREDNYSKYASSP